MSIAGLHQWSSRLDAAIRGRTTVIRRAMVLAETASTQDAALRLARPGDAVVAARQTAGRGRLGRAWADTGDEGVALTLALDVVGVERLAIAAAVGMALGAEPFAGCTLGIKWPNDLVAAGPPGGVAARKLAGALVERRGGLTLLGVGLNVNQMRWPAELSGRAVSLRELRGGAGNPIDRVEVIAALVVSLDGALTLGDGALIAEFERRDALRGTVTSFSSPTVRPGAIRGRVLGLDPLRGLGVVPVAESAMLWLPAATTSVVIAPAASETPAAGKSGHGDASI